MRWNTIVFLTCLALCACGIKPGAVDPPQGQGSSDFPRSYPDTGTDPQPITDVK